MVERQRRHSKLTQEREQQQLSQQVQVRLKPNLIDLAASEDGSSPVSSKSSASGSNNSGNSSSLAQKAPQMPTSNESTDTNNNNNDDRNKLLQTAITSIHNHQHYQHHIRHQQQLDTQNLLLLQSSIGQNGMAASGLVHQQELASSGETSDLQDSNSVDINYQLHNSASNNSSSQQQQQISDNLNLSSMSSNNNNNHNHNHSSSNGSTKQQAETSNNFLGPNDNNNSIRYSMKLKQIQQPQHEHQQGTTAREGKRSLEELRLLIRDVHFDRMQLSNEELIWLVKNQIISVYKLESFLGKDNAARCVQIRRDFYRQELSELDDLDLNGVKDRAKAFDHPSYEELEYEKVNGACCENVIGHVKIPVGLAGPLILDGEEIFVPLATTEGCLVASTCRGLSALRKSGGVSSRVRRDFMTRAPIVRFKDANLRDALDNVERAIAWLNNKTNREKMSSAFNLTSSHGRFLNYTMYPVNREIHIRFEAQTGDAMGMNMCSKGVENALKEMQCAFPSMEIVTLSGNMCVDKKAAGINWINGRGKSVECNAELPAQVVQQVFKVSVDSMIDRWKSKVMVGSALAASIGGFNSQAANILTAIFIATGQDPAQNVTSSNCMLILEKDSRGSLVVCCTMPSIECGTVGGGTILADQSRHLQMMGVRGPTGRQAGSAYRPNPLRQQARPQMIPERANHNHIIHQNGLGNNSTKELAKGKSLINDTSYVSQNHQVGFSSAASTPPINSTNEHTNARKLARIVCATVMAGELSLLAALTEGTLVKSHMRHNRSSTNVQGLSSSQSGLSSSGGSQHCFGPAAYPSPPPASPHLNYHNNIGQIGQIDTTANFISSSANNCSRVNSSNSSYSIENSFSNHLSTAASTSPSRSHSNCNNDDSKTGSNNLSNRVETLEARCVGASLLVAGTGSGTTATPTVVNLGQTTARAEEIGGTDTGSESCSAGVSGRGVTNGGSGGGGGGAR